MLHVRDHDLRFNRVGRLYDVQRIGGRHCLHFVEEKLVFAILKTF